MLPILHLNGYKIANPTVLARIPHGELDSLLPGYGYHGLPVEGDDPALVHQQLAAILDAIIDEIRAIQRRARDGGDLTRPHWPMIILDHAEGLDRAQGRGRQAGRGNLPRAPGADRRGPDNPEHLPQLEEWMRSYRAEELFDGSGTLVPELARLAPPGDRRMSANPHANGGLLLRELRAARLPGLRGGGQPARATDGRGHPGARHLAAGRDQGQPV